jgi:hypothetical protein
VDVVVIDAREAASHACGSTPLSRAVWRQVEVPTSITLKVLHDIIQAVIGWFDYHLWEFTIVKQKYGLPMDDDWETEPRRLGCLTAAN